MFELSEIITADGVVYDLMDFYAKFVLRNPTNMGIPEVEPLTVRAGQQGEYLVDYLLNPRELTMDIRHQGCSREEYWELRLALLDILRPNRNGQMTYVFTVPTGTQYAIKGLVTEFPFANIPEGWDQWGFSETLSIFCVDPIWFNNEATETNFIQSGASELVFPITFTPSGPTIYFEDTSTWGTASITYLGTWYSYPTFTVTGPFTSVYFSHDNLGVAVQLNYAAEAGETITVNLEERTVTDANGVDLFGYLSSLTNLIGFRLEPDPVVSGGVNTISVQLAGNDGSNIVTMSYRTRWIGI